MRLLPVVLLGACITAPTEKRSVDELLDALFTDLGITPTDCGTVSHPVCADAEFDEDARMLTTCLDEAWTLCTPARAMLRRDTDGTDVPTGWAVYPTDDGCQLTVFTDTRQVDDATLTQASCEELIPLLDCPYLRASTCFEDARWEQ